MDMSFCTVCPAMFVISKDDTGLGCTSALGSGVTHNARMETDAMIRADKTNGKKASLLLNHFACSIGDRFSCQNLIGQWRSLIPVFE
jgi:hypothetical protein